MNLNALIVINKVVLVICLLFCISDTYSQSTLRCGYMYYFYKDSIDAKYSTPKDYLFFETDSIDGNKLNSIDFTIDKGAKFIDYGHFSSINFDIVFKYGEQMTFILDNYIPVRKQVLNNGKTLVVYKVFIEGKVVKLPLNVYVEGISNLGNSYSAYKEFINSEKQRNDSISLIKPNLISILQ